MEKEYAFQAINITKSFGGLKALNDVSIDLEKNRILGLIGPNGSGKTTFFNVTSGLVPPNEGQILFDGQELTGKKPQQIARLGVLRTFQTSRLWFELSIIDNLLLGMWMRKKPGAHVTLFRHAKLAKDFVEKAEEAKEILNIFNPELASNCYRCVGDLALVDRRRVEICRAAVAGPKLLLLDEPAAGMDPSETRELMDDIRKLKEKTGDLTIIIIEHDMAVISSIAEHVVVFNFGRKIAEGTFNDIKSNDEVRQAYLGKEFSDA